MDRDKELRIERRITSLEGKQDTQTEILKEIRDDGKQTGKSVARLNAQVEALVDANLQERVAKIETKQKLTFGIGTAGLVSAVGLFIKSILPRLFGV